MPLPFVVLDPVIYAALLCFLRGIRLCRGTARKAQRSDRYGDYESFLVMHA